tara:strand:+ start:801541 stop:802218 length:678 start_codon:yes stop_codon:yes gene_type:complete
MTSIYQQILGKKFDDLHPMIQRRFGFSSEDNICSIGTGVMQRVWHGAPYTLPFLCIGAWRNIMFPESGRDIPFQVHNYAYKDSFGRETVTWIREFNNKRPRRFDATMINSEQRGKIVDYLGTHQHLAVDIDMDISENGGIRLRSGEQRFFERFIGFRFPLLFSGVAEVCEWFDETSQKFHINVHVHNNVWGPLFGYSGTFTCEWKACTPEQVPQTFKPVREERRE